jgi:hypothetical protein
VTGERSLAHELKNLLHAWHNLALGPKLALCDLCPR